MNRTYYYVTAIVALGMLAAPAMGRAANPANPAEPQNVPGSTDNIANDLNAQQQKKVEDEQARMNKEIEDKNAEAMRQWRIQNGMRMEEWQKKQQQNSQ
jgi:hypothetical protein